MRSTTLVLLAAVLTIAWVAGCTKSGPEGVSQPNPAKGPSATNAAATPPAGGEMTILMVPKLKGIDYFNACQQGAEEAAKEIGGVKLIYDGPTEDKVDAQIQLIEGYIAQNVSAIAVAPNDPDSIAPVLKKARDKGIHVLTWDADASPEKSGREFFVNQASSEAVGQALVDEMVAQVGDKAEVAIVTSSLTSANQNAWIAAMKADMAAKYPNLKMVCEPKPTQEDQQLAFQAAQDLLKTYPGLKGIWAISSVSFPGAAEGVQQAGKSGKIAVVGLATPKPMRQWVDGGTVKTVVLWNPVDLGYLTVQTAKALCDGKLAADAKTLTAGRLGEVQIVDQQVLLGKPMLFNKDNIAQFDF